MFRLQPLVAGTLIAAAGLIGVNGIAYATTGSSVILGHSNHANRVTKITRTTAGPALALRVKAHQVPFTVNSTEQVAKLNASYVGGLSAASLQTRAIEFPLPSSTTAISSGMYPLSVPAGTYYVSFNVVAQMTTAGDRVSCVLERASDFSERLLGYGAAYGSFSTAEASGVVTVVTGQPLQLRCFGNTGTYKVDTGVRSIVDFMKIDGVSTRSSAAAMAHPRAAHRAATGR